MDMLAAKALLHETDKHGVSVYSHLTEVLAALLENDKIDALSSFETISLQVKEKHFRPEAVAPAPTPSVDLLDEERSWHDGTNELLRGGPPAETEDAGDVSIPNLIEEADFLSVAGVGLSKEEAYRVYVSLHKLQKLKELESIRFFGKILGTQAHYYIAEASYPPAADDEEPLPEGTVPTEEKGVGCNSYAYFATNDPAGTWTELPVVTPDQLVAAARIRKFFTGDMAAPVRAYPPFPGTEKEYLRAQIARICAATVLCAKGKYMIEEESDPPKVVDFEPEEDEAPPPLTAAAMLEPSSWLRYNMGILNIGRCTHPPTEEEEEEEPKKDEPPLQPLTPPLTPIAADEWSLQVFKHMGAGVCAAVARSLRWPGAYSATNVKENKSFNIYIGYGQAALSQQFTVQPPPAVQSEPDDVIEQMDMPLDEENAPVIAAAKAALAETVAAEAEAAAEADDE
ncbi:hypothetical protein AB1Y20_016695 [Prymnesium parvum]|uniref:Radial spokehead-like protein n=1 Tax=Prymnesium parvum TaxID=97485 RepID=A0AB34IAS8_PRYPA